MPSGSGLVAGAGYVAGDTSDLFALTADARYSTRRFSLFGAGLRLFPAERSSRPVEARITARVADYPSLRHFGLGAAQTGADRTVYGLEERTLEAAVDARPSPFLRFGADLRWTTAETGPGARGPSLETRFLPRETPGFGVATRYLVYGGEAELTLRDRSVNPAVGVVVTAAGHRYDERNGDRYDFTRLVGELQAHVPLGYRNRILALRARTSHAVGRDGVLPPFYLLETIGGADTIRGFPEYRFRDARNLLLNVEYRWEVWTYLDFALFYDAGKVFRDARDMSLRGLEAGYGFGARAHAAGETVIRFDFAWSEKGFVLHIGSGPSF